MSMWESHKLFLALSRRRTIIVNTRCMVVTCWQDSSYAVETSSAGELRIHFQRTTHAYKHPSAFFVKKPTDVRTGGVVKSENVPLWYNIYQSVDFGERLSKKAVAVGPLDRYVPVTCWQNVSEMSRSFLVDWLLKILFKKSKSRRVGLNSVKALDCIDSAWSRTFKSGV